MIRILIADDHRLFRKGLRQVIDNTPDMIVADEAATGKAVLALINQNDYNLVILDITMPGSTGLDLLKQIKHEKPNSRVLILTMHPEEQYALHALKAGAAGYLTKEADENILVEAIHKINGGGKYITPTLAENLAFAMESDVEKPAHEMLSAREYQVMCRIASGKSTREISLELNIGLSTVSTYRHRILEKLGLKNNAQVIKYALKNKIIDA